MAQGVELAAAYVSLTVSAKGIARDIERELGQPVDRAARDAGRSIEQGIGGGASRGAEAAKVAISAIGSAAVLGAINRAKDAASGLQQAVGGTSAVFGEASDAVDDFADHAAESVGLSERVARELTSQIGASLKGYGFAVDEAADKSIELTQLGADLAATFGGTTADAVAALSSALRGEFDPLERYGVSLRQSAIDAQAVALGLVDAGQEVDAMSRAQAALSLITEQSADAQGQFARESDSAAGQAQISSAKMEDAAANLGESLLPIYAQISEAVGTVADIFAVLPGPVQTGILALAGIVAVAGPLTNVVNLYRTFTPVVAANTVALEANVVAENSAVAVQNLYAASTGRSALATRAFSTALGVAATAFAGFAIGSGVVAESRRRASDAASEEVAQLNATLSATQTYQQFQDQLNASIGRYNELVDDANSGTDIFANDDLAQYTHQLGPALEQQIALNDVIAAYAEQTGDADGALQLLTGHQEEAALLLSQGYTPAEAAAEIAVGARADAERQAATRTEAYGDATQDAADAAANLAAQVDAAREAQQRYVDGVLGTLDAELGFESAVLNTQDALRDMDEVYADSEASAEDRERAVIAAFQAIIDQGDAAVEAAEAQNGDISLSATETATIQRDALASVAQELAPGSDLRVRLDEWIGRLDEVPTHIQTEVDFVARAENLQLTAAGLDPGLLALFELLNAQPRAAGGGFDSGWLLAGEEGPELIRVGQPGYVFNAPETAEVFAGATGGDTYNFYGPTEPEKVGREVRRVHMTARS